MAHSLRRSPWKAEDSKLKTLCSVQIFQGTNCNLLHQLHTPSKQTTLILYLPETTKVISVTSRRRQHTSVNASDLQGDLFTKSLLYYVMETVSTFRLKQSRNVEERSHFTAAKPITIHLSFLLLRKYLSSKSNWGNLRVHADTLSELLKGTNASTSQMSSSYLPLCFPWWNQWKARSWCKMVDVLLKTAHPVHRPTARQTW